MKKWVLAVCGIVATIVVALVVLSGVAVWQGGSLAARAAGAGIDQARAMIEEALPQDARRAANARLDAMIESLRAGRFDPAVLREVAGWLPGAVADGRLDASEREALWEKLGRLTPGEGGVDAPVRS